MHVTILKLKLTEGRCERANSFFSQKATGPNTETGV
jgi:hypothetical protein